MSYEPIYKKPPGVVTRWASMENPKGLKGQGGMSNHGRKGTPAIRPLAPGQTVVLAQAEGSGCIRHIWITLESHKLPQALKGIRLEMYWDGCETPGVSASLGDFFGCITGKPYRFENRYFSSPEGRSFNCFIPMPFKKGMKIVATNESSISEPQFFYQIDYTLGDVFDEGTLYFHAHSNRVEKNRIAEDMEILPRVQGSGRYLGASVGLLANPKMKGTWWGEGEVKCYIDGDTAYPTLCGTGSEDYVGTGWGMGEYQHREQGCLEADNEKGFYNFYRFHALDPVWFDEDIRITIQQIGCSEKEGLDSMKAAGLTVRHAGGDVVDYETTPGAIFERFDEDWFCMTYFYLDKPENGLPALPPVQDRLRGFVQEQ